MPHSYPLHKPLHVPCSCCGLRYQARFSNNREDVVCPGCSGHKSGKMPPHERERRHKEMWLAEIRQCASDARSARALRTKAAELRQQLDDIIETGVAGASDDVRSRWETQQVLQAEQEKWEAYRRRDAAETVLLSVYHLHHPSRERPGRCSCGSLERDCRVRYAIQPMDKRMDRLDRMQRDSRDY